MGLQAGQGQGRFCRSSKSSAGVGVGGGLSFIYKQMGGTCPGCGAEIWAPGMSRGQSPFAMAQNTIARLWKLSGDLF